MHQLRRVLIKFAECHVCFTPESGPKADIPGCTLDWAEETGQISSGLGPFIEQEARRAKAYVNREQFPTRADKQVRAQSIRGRMSMDGRSRDSGRIKSPHYHASLALQAQPAVMKKEANARLHLSAQQWVGALRDVRFTPESGHVRCN